MRRRLVVGLLSIGLGAVAVGAVALAALPSTYEAQVAGVRVRWAASVDDATRRTAEQRYHLTAGSLREGRTWAYTLDDTGVPNIRALIGDPAVEDTAEIDRARGRVSRESMRDRPPRSLRPRLSAGLRVAAVLGWLVGLSCLCLAVAERVSPGSFAWRTRGAEAPLVPLSPRQRALMVLLIGSLLALEIGSMQRLSITADEPQHLLYGQNLLKLDATRFDDSKMPISVLNALPGALAPVVPAGAISVALAKPVTGRYATVAFSLVTALVVFMWARRLYGTDGGLLALTLYVFDPNLLAHAQLTTTDVYAAGTVTMALCAWGRFLHRGGWKAGLASALLLGLAQVAKYTAVVLYPLMAVVAVFFHLGAIRHLARARAWGSLGR